MSSPTKPTKEAPVTSSKPLEIKAIRCHVAVQFLAVVRESIGLQDGAIFTEHPAGVIVVHGTVKKLIPYTNIRSLDLVV